MFVKISLIGHGVMVVWRVNFKNWIVAHSASMYAYQDEIHGHRRSCLIGGSAAPAPVSYNFLTIAGTLRKSAFHDNTNSPTRKSVGGALNPDLLCGSDKLIWAHDHGGLRCLGKVSAVIGLPMKPATKRHVLEPFSGRKSGSRIWKTRYNSGIWTRPRKAPDTNDREGRSYKKATLSGGNSRRLAYKFVKERWRRAALGMPKREGALNDPWSSGGMVHFNIGGIDDREWRAMMVGLDTPPRMERCSISDQTSAIASTKSSSRQNPSGEYNSTSRTLGNNNNGRTTSDVMMYIARLADTYHNPAPEEKERWMSDGGGRCSGCGGLRKESQGREDPHEEMGLPGWIEPLGFPGGGNQRYDGRLLRS
ncbi:hypothetical protein B0H17DRAFT_1262417 [Mycena rosella]|uniref:Uncharacterized protein n=1 Tax=Mycena rosella TaxID=1033263 RepID=A0AAD7CQE6_MYCRO|nr:hypothetical protein B0H17DRAFT_1262417 [Mycena rosella]